MAGWNSLEKAELQRLAEDAQKRYNEWKSKKLSLDMTRGKPCPEQLDLANRMLTCLKKDDYKSENGTDCRNYGGLDGIPEARALFAEYLGVGADDIIIGGNSSLNIMYNTVSAAMMRGVPGGKGPWSQEKVKFLCPSPGYDRHFSVCEYFGIEMVIVEMGPKGLDIDKVAELVGSDPAVKGIWCVPKYSNPTGHTYTDDMVDRLASMPAAAGDFRIFCDNAYSAHQLGRKPDQLKNIFEACKAAGNPDRIYLFGSTSKISFAGAGLSFMAASKANLDAYKASLAMQTIGPDKLNMLRHVRFFKDLAGIEKHMKKQAKIIKPKFDAVVEILKKNLDGKGIATWSNPKGGYFISFDVLDGCAQEVVKLAAEAGVKLTKAGATFPYGKDPNDRNIRIAPTLPSLEEIRQATELLSVCVEVVSARKLLG
ncbi:MAG: aminotransferase class I/II-fold pyridoxal phosphate-dependent enzyme [Planctomycetes bacterium]|nr:aminotransferase class I/II-fold pyridoxal phosphate-dependent enzyme [Planctomycetota bacterium]